MNTMCEQNVFYFLKLKMVLHVMFKLTGCDHNPQPIL